MHGAKQEVSEGAEAVTHLRQAGRCQPSSMQQSNESRIQGFSFILGLWL